MSVTLCTPRHLTVLGAYAVRNGLSGLVEPRWGGVLDRVLVAEAFRILAEANAVSFSALYGQTIAVSDMGEPHSPSFTVEAMDPIMIVKACDFYEHQACHFPAWEESKAKAMIDRVRQDAIRKLPGYAAAPWGL